MTNLSNININHELIQKQNQYISNNSMKADLIKEKMNSLEKLHIFDEIEKKFQYPVSSDTKIRGCYDNYK